MLTDIATVFWRDWLILRRRLGKFIFSRMVAPLLYLFAFGWGLGRNIPPQADGTYLDFLVPGILALNSMNLSFSSVIPVHAERVYHKSLEEYLLAPISPAALVLGKIASAVTRSLISSVIIIILAVFAGAKFYLSIMFIAVLTLNSIIFAAVGFWAAMILDTYEEMGQVNTYILLPMSFLCGTFFSLHTMPPLMSGILTLLPLTHTSELLRGLALSDTFNMLSLIILLVYALLCFRLALRSLHKLTL